MKGFIKKSNENERNHLKTLKKMKTNETFNKNKEQKNNGFKNSLGLRQRLSETFFWLV